MKKILSTILVVLALVNTGCVSRYAHSQWKDAKEKQAIRIEANGEQVMVGVDVTALTYIKENPGVATLAALADAGIAYGVYRLGQEVFDSGSKSSSNQRNNDINISGNQSSSININISGDQDNDPVNNNDTSNNNYE